MAALKSRVEGHPSVPGVSCLAQNHHTRMGFPQACTVSINPCGYSQISQMVPSAYTEIMVLVMGCRVQFITSVPSQLLGLAGYTVCLNTEGTSGKLVLGLLVWDWIIPKISISAQPLIYLTILQNGNILIQSQTWCCRTLLSGFSSVYTNTF